MEKIVITAGEKYTDIDVLACAVAYAELLNNEGKNAEAVVSKILNKSITVSIKKWNINYSTKFTGANHFVIVDTSHPEYLSSFVDIEKVIELYDHHSGFEDIWNKKLGKKSHIEHIGACATLIWEEFKRRSSKKISETSANLLYTAIVSNTLNFKAQISSKRDLSASNELIKYTQLPVNWIEIYFEEQEKSVYKNPIKEMQQDVHTEEFPQLNGKIVICQTEMWNGKKFISEYLKDIQKALDSFEEKYSLFTSPSISQGKNYLYTKYPEVKELLEKIIHAKFDGDIGTTDKLWLRKEIQKKLQDISIKQMDIKSYYERQISLSEWFEGLSYKSTTEFRVEDNEKRERLRFLKKEIGMPFDEPVQFEATDLSKKTHKFEKYFQKHSEEYCALRLIPKDPQLPKLRMRGLIIRKAYDWFKEQEIDPTKYRAEFIPHSEKPIWSTIFIVNKNGIFGEIIRGMHNQLTQGFFDVNKPILFSYNFKKLALSVEDKEAEEELRRIIDYLYVKDRNKQKAIQQELKVKFFKNYFEGYFETISVEEFGLWFVDFNRILGKAYKDFKLDLKRSTKSKSNIAKVLQGRSASLGTAKGVVRILTDGNVFKKTLNKGDILVCEMTTPDYIVHLKKAGAIITDKGGILCHAAIVAREFEIPCVVGTNNATSTLKEGSLVEVDAEKGIIKILE